MKSFALLSQNGADWASWTIQYIKKFVSTALTVVAKAQEKISKPADLKRKTAKADVDSDILVQTHLAKSQQQKSIADALGIRKDGSPKKT